MKILLWMLALLLLAGSGHAGTLISGSNVDVKSNYDGFNGLSLVGTYSTTPAANDIITITNAQLPEPYGLKQTVTITVPEPRIEQVFDVNNQRQVYKVIIVKERTYYYLNLPYGQTASELCKEKLTADIQANYGNLPLLEGTGANLLVGNGVCYAQFALQQTQVGWLGSVSERGLYYYQDINLAGIGTLHLERSAAIDDLSDKIDGVGRATLLNFGTWTNSDLSAAGIYAFHARTSDGTKPWRAFQDTSTTNYVGSYTNAINALQSQLFTGDAPASLTEFRAVGTSAVEKGNIINNMAANIQGATATIPASWSGKIDGTIRTSANSLIVPLNGNIFTANIQLVLAGEKFGLYIPTGKPSIVSASSSITFQETGTGYLDYTVKNIGTNTGTFVLKGFCADGKVLTQEVEMSLAAGATKSGRLAHTAKSETFDLTEKVACSLRFEEIQTDEFVSKAYSVEVQVKQSCVEGEQSDPKFSPDGRTQTVYVLDSSCNVKDELTCDVTTSIFEKVNGVWTCVQKDNTTPTPNPDNDNDGTFRPGLLLFAAVVGVLAGGWAAILVPAPKKHFFAIKGAVFVVAALIVFVGVAYVARIVVNLFTLSIGG